MLTLNYLLNSFMTYFIKSARRKGVIVDFVVLYESRAFLVLRIKTTTFIVSEAGKSDPKSLFLS